MDTYNLTTATELQQAVHTIKTAILKSQSRAARLISGTQLSLYFGVGLYVSSNSRKGTWGTGAIEDISNQLRRELPGLKGFSAQNIRNMRQFAEFWQTYLIYSPMASKMEVADLQVLDDKVRKPHENPSIGIVLCKMANQAYAEYAVRDYNKPMGIATYKTFADMPKEMQHILPDVDALKKLLEESIEQS
jgi:hypothetical protein